MANTYVQVVGSPVVPWWLVASSEALKAVYEETFSPTLPSVEAAAAHTARWGQEPDDEFACDVLEMTQDER
jgi:hypothetical protein